MLGSMKRGLTLKKGRFENRGSTSTARDSQDLINDLTFPDPSSGTVTSQPVVNGAVSADPTPRRHSQLSHNLPAKDLLGQHPWNMKSNTYYSGLHE